MQMPTVGRIVHYQAFGSPGGEHPSAPRAAIVTEVFPDSDEIGVCILNPTGIFFNKVKYDWDAKPGTWRWPPQR